MIFLTRNFADTLQREICHAQRNIKMIVFCWTIWEEKKCESLFKINEAIRYTARRGVEVKCLTGSEGLTRRARDLGIEAKCLTNFKIVHAKFFLIDDKKLFIGSHNLTKSGLESNLECSAVIDFTDVDNEANLFFDRLWKN